MTGFGIRTSMRRGISLTLATFLLLIDIAVNPPVPPSRSAFEIWDYMRLEDLLPAARFLRILDVCAEKRLIVSNLDDNAYLASVVAELCEFANLTCVSLGDVDPFPKRPWSGFQTHFASRANSRMAEGIERRDSGKLSSHTYFDYVCWNYSSACAQRRSSSQGEL